MNTLPLIALSFLSITCLGSEHEAPAPLSVLYGHVNNSMHHQAQQGEFGFQMATATAADDDDDASDIIEAIRRAITHDDIRSQVRSHVNLHGSPARLAISTQLTFIDLLHLYLPDVKNVNNECKRDLLAIFRTMADLKNLVANGTIWPLQLVDSWGKSSDGLMVGNMLEIGFFKECVDIRVLQYSSELLGPPDLQSSFHRTLDSSTDPHDNLSDLHNAPNDLTSTATDDLRSNTISDVPTTADFRGQYCLLSYTVNGSKMEAAPPTPGLRVPELSTLLQQGIALMAYGTCMPSTCTRQELKDTVDAALVEKGLKVSGAECYVKEQRHLSGSEVTGIVIIALLLLVLALATLADLVTAAESRQHFRQGPLQYLLAFSVSYNLQKLLHMDNSRSPNVISSIHGIRFLSITWVVLGHQYAFTLSFVQNIIEIPEMTKTVMFQLIGNADLSVDTFFLLSGLLVTLGLLGQVNTVKRFSVPLYYVHRLLRLWPPLALTTMLVATVSGLAVSGPLSGQYWSSYIKGCRHSWWIDVTLVSNLVYPYLDQMNKAGESASCILQGWYVGVDTQLYLIMPLVLLPLAWWPRRGQVWLGVWTLASLVTPAAIVGAYHLWPSSLLVVDPAASLEYNHKVYMMPWCRAGPYLVGAWAGYFLHLGKRNPSLTILKHWQVLIGWAAAAGVALGVLLGIARYNYAVLPPAVVPEMSTAEAVAYGGLHRAAWGAAVAWVIVACHWGYGGPVDYVLSHPLWQPLSRLTYLIYLTSLPIQIMLISSTYRPTYYTHYAKVQEALGVLLLSSAVSIFVSLCTEGPVLRLEKMLLRPKEQPRDAAPPQPHAAPSHRDDDPEDDSCSATSDHTSICSTQCTNTTQ